ncbi:RagB/SusD family nutrient uptake outer membrane protein [Pedobacter sp. NJ-S-72]
MKCEYLQLDQNAIPTDNVITVSVYQKIYRTINSANSVIAGLPAVTDPLLNQAEKNKILGEAYFIRALGYFDLARGWGGVQLQLKPTVDINGIRGVKRSTLVQTYDQVLADLVQAEQLLPEDDSNTRNRAQKSTAKALRARLNLYRENWADAVTYASQVIGNPKFTLVNNFKSFFTAPFLSTESVFELTFSANDQNNYWSLWYPSALGGSYQLKPSASLISKINDPAIGGSRISLIGGTGNSIYGALYNTAGANIDPSYLIRISELYLIRAEAKAHLNDLDGALADLNIIRKRAGVSPVTSGTQTDILQAIADENSVEFAFEAHRWFDLVRTKQAGKVLGLPQYKLLVISYSLLRYTF